MTRLLRTLGLALVVGLAIAPTARADDASEAALHFELGAGLYASRRYTEALDHFLAAHRLAPNPSYAFNIAQTYALLDRPADAYNWYETYLRDHVLSAEDRADGERRRDALAPGLAILEVETEPSGAEIFVDRVELGSVGHAPRRIAVAAGEHALVFRAPDHHDGSASATAIVGSVTAVRTTLERVHGTLRVETTPPGAVARLDDGTELGTTPLEANVPTGTHVLSLELEEHVAERRTVVIAEGEPLVVAVTLAPNPSTTSVLSVIAEAEVVVVLDGERLGVAPLSLDGLSPRTARLELSAPSHDPWSGDIVLEPGAATRVTATLRDLDAEAPDAWAWLGYVAGGITLAAALVTGGVALALDAAFDAAAFGNPTAELRASARDTALAADVLGPLAALLLGGTLVWDLSTGPPAPSSASVEIER